NVRHIRHRNSKIGAQPGAGLGRAGCQVTVTPMSTPTRYVARAAAPPSTTWRTAANQRARPVNRAAVAPTTARPSPPTLRASHRSEAPNRYGSSGMRAPTANVLNDENAATHGLGA